MAKWTPSTWGQKKNKDGHKDTQTNIKSCLKKTFIHVSKQELGKKKINNLIIPSHSLLRPPNCPRVDK